MRQGRRGTLGHKDAYYKPDLKEYLLFEFRKGYHAVCLSKDFQATRISRKVSEEKKELENNLSKEVRLLRLENEKIRLDYQERIERLVKLSNEA